MKVFFVGAGPGDPELITLKAVRLIKQSPVLIYTGSLVPKEILEHAREGAEIYDSASMNLDEIISVIKKAHKDGKNVARVHTGDPSLYSAIAEQIRRLEDLGISYQVVPGVSSFSAAAAAISQELTLPETSQTVILTRVEGRTPVPPKEKLADLASHRATLVLFLSTGLIEKVVSEVVPHYGEDCPVRVVYKASHKDQQIVSGTLCTIGEKLAEMGIKSTAIIMIGEVLERGDFPDSKLYHADFKHMFR